MAYVVKVCGLWLRVKLQGCGLSAYGEGGRDKMLSCWITGYPSAYQRP